MNTKPSLLLLITAFAVVYIIWGSTYLAIRIAIETVPPFFMAGTRFLIAGTLLFAWCRLRSLKPKWNHWRAAFIAGGLLLLGGNGAVVWSEQWVPSGIAALLIATVPLWTVLLEWFWQKKRRPHAGVITGVALGFVGIACLVSPAREAGAKGVHPLGVAALLFAALSWSVGSIYTRKANLPESSSLTNSMEMIGGGSLLMCVSFISGEWGRVHWDHFSSRSVLAIAYLIFFGALLGFSAYKFILKHTTPTLSSTYAYVNPVIAVLLGWAFAGELLTPKILLGAVVIITAVVLITCFNREEPTASSSSAG